MFGFKSNKRQKPSGLIVTLKQSLAKTRTTLANGLVSLLHGKKHIDPSLLEQLEDQLLAADVGISATEQITATLMQQLEQCSSQDDVDVLALLKQIMVDILEPCCQALTIDNTQKPFVILMVGVNGAGKTTTLGKLAQQYKSQGLRVMLAAGDTFRAAAVEQIQQWGDKLDIAVIKQNQGSDSASVIYDALESAKSRNVDVLIADTAGRLHTQDNLMQELEKIKRVMSKLNPHAPHETILVIDAGTGQNALAQATSFNSAIGIDSLIVTKLDGTAKAGMLFSVAQKLKLPIRYIGVGESAKDLRSFNNVEFVDALLAESE